MIPAPLMGEYYPLFLRVGTRVCGGIVMVLVTLMSKSFAKYKQLSTGYAWFVDLTDKNLDSHWESVKI